MEGAGRMSYIYRVLIKTERATDWHPLNSKVYLDVADAERALQHSRRNSDFFRWGDQFKIQTAEIPEGLWRDFTCNNTPQDE